MSAPVDVPPSSTVGAPSRRALMKGAAWAAPVAAFAVGAPAMAVSCVSGSFDGAARGRIFTGDILGLSLDQDFGAQLLTLNGVTANNLGLPSDEESNNLEVTALGGLLDLQLTGLGQPLSSVLQFATNTDTGVYNQYAFADEDGTEIGASGYVDGAGTLQTGGASGGAYPDFGTIELRQILNSPLLSTLPIVESLVDGVLGADSLKLSIGAIAGRAQRQQNCEAGISADLTREYLVGHLRLDVAPADSTLVSTLVTALTEVDLGLNISALLPTILTAIRNVLVVGPVVADLIESTAEITGTIRVGTAALGNVIPAPTGGPQPLQISLADGGRITIDLAEAAGVGYSPTGGGLNNVPANSVLFVNSDLATAEDAVASTAQGLVTWLYDLLASVVEVDLTVTAKVGLLGARVDVIRITGNLTNLDVSLLNITLPLGGIAAAIGTALKPLIEGGLRTLINNALAPVNALLKLVFTLLYQVIHIRLNAQNDPAANVPATINATNPGEPANWGSWGQAASGSDRYDVAALHLSAVGLLDVLNLFLARGSVGPSTQRAA